MALLIVGYMLSGHLAVDGHMSLANNASTLVNEALSQAVPITVTIVPLKGKRTAKSLSPLLINNPPRQSICMVRTYLALSDGVLIKSSRTSQQAGQQT